MRTSQQAVDELKVELKKAYEVMVKLKNQIGRPIDPQYDQLLKEIAEEFGEIRFEQAATKTVVSKVIKIVNN